MHDSNEAECTPAEEAAEEGAAHKRVSLPDGCGYRLGIFVFFGFAIWLAISLLGALAS